MLDVWLFLRAGAFVAGVAAFLVATPSSALADTGDAVLADSLYEEGKVLFQRKEFSAACPKLAESDRLDPAGGTVLMLAECYEGEGKIASAWVAYGEALSRAQRDRRSDRAEEAKTRLAALEPRIPRTIIDVPDEVRAIRGLSVKRSGTDVPSVSFGISVMADPGRVEVTAQAPGYEPFHANIDVGEGETQRIRVTLAREPAPPPARPDPAAPLSVSVPISITLGVVGVAAVVVGGYFGGAAIQDAHQVNDVCHGQSTCSDRAMVDLAHTADREANIANVLLPVGGAALVSGLVVILVMGPRQKPKPAVALTPQASGSPGLSVWGSF
jgi:hypothetical protein